MQIVVQGPFNYENVITDAELKAHLRVTHSLEDNLIQDIRAAAIQYVEQYCNTRLGSFTAYGYLPDFRSSYIPIGPVNSVTAVEYETDNSGTLATLAAANWHTDIKSHVGRIAFSDYPEPYEYAIMPVRITMNVGHAYTLIPAPLMAAVRLIAGHLYENRQDEVIGTITSRLRLGVDALVSPFRYIHQS